MGKGETSGPVDAVACCLIEYAARRAPTALSERMLEEWLADLAGHRGRMARLRFTLPLMTQSVRLNLPQGHSSDQAPAEVINLEIDFDGTVVWNGAPVASFQQLEGYLRAEGRKHPQPEIHLRPDAYVKYDVVAKVLAAAQRNQLTKVGFVNSAEFAN